MIRPKTRVTLYEVWEGNKPTMKCFHVSGSTCFILKDRDHKGEFDLKSEEGIFFSYAINSKAYRVFNKRTKKIIKLINVVVDDARVHEIHSDAGGGKTLNSVSEGELTPLGRSKQEAKEVPSPISIAKFKEKLEAKSQDVQVTDLVNDQSNDDRPL
ncbi:hypothetical protein PVK06_044578 [Gossypium arboreum]|uniref:Retroviral polymerase SH3-like domain-containing protein n=1 Tax=Gossypium arboreum TaxID=29729 RepID=A0ABR0MRN1_GOSAR|nr:hypothetical protein PVK06_044578 [Gossypium arboreum]